MKKRVLIVEDNELNLKLFKDLLETHGFDVVDTRDGVEAFDLARRSNPDLILMDIQLHGISGFDIIKRLKKDEEMKSIPIIAVTAFAMKDDEEKILQSGCEAYISKPISIGPFLETINSFLEEEKAGNGTAKV